MTVTVPRILGLTAILTAIGIAFAPRAMAHPHAWIDIESTAIIDETGRLTGLEQYWLFGDFYSSYVLADIGSDDRDVIIANLREVARQNIVNLREYDYFTVIEGDGERRAIQDVETFETGVVEGRIYLKFTTRLEEPVDPMSAAVRYAVYDPTYYIEVLYAEDATPQIRTPADVECDLAVEKPSPTFDELAFAASLDKTESGGDGLGKVFAEWVDLTCR